MSSPIFTSFEEKATFYFEFLSKLTLYKKEERIMLVVNFSPADKSCPRLLHIIKEEDGYTHRILEQDTHSCMEEGFITEDELMTLLPKTEGGRTVQLFWGPFQIL